MDNLKIEVIDINKLKPYEKNAGEFIPRHRGKGNLFPFLLLMDGLKHVLATLLKILTMVK